MSGVLGLDPAYHLGALQVQPELSVVPKKRDSRTAVSTVMPRFLEQCR